MLQCNDYINSLYQVSGLTEQSKIMHFINECNNLTAVDCPYNLQEYKVKKEKLFERYININSYEQ